MYIYMLYIYNYIRYIYLFILFMYWSPQSMGFLVILEVSSFLTESPPARGMFGTSQVHATMPGNPGRVELSIILEAIPPNRIEHSNQKSNQNSSINIDIAIVI